MVYFWQETYRDAMAELDANKLTHKIYNAEAVIARREKALVGTAEGFAISDALAALKVIRRME